MDPFAVPMRLINRKRRHPTSQAFFTAEEYDAYSIFGDVYESTLYADEEERRQSVVNQKSPGLPVNKQLSTTETNQTQVTEASSTSLLETLAATTRKQHAVAPKKHLLQILYEKKRQRELDPAENAYRRLSSLTIDQHLMYLQLLQKRIQAQRRGLPAILALSSEELIQWNALDALVRAEQALLYHAMERIARRDALATYTFLPHFVSQWYDQVRMVMRNDVFRLYPRHYELCMELPSNRTVYSDASASQELVLKHVKQVSQFGSAFTLAKDALLKTQVVLLRDLVTPSIDAVYMTRDAISTDLGAEELMEKYDCEIAITSSTILTLFDNNCKQFDAPHGWIVPTKSRVSMTKSGAKKRIYVDRMLPMHAVGARQKYSDACRAKLLTYLKQTQATQEPPVDPQAAGQRAYHVWQLGDRRVLVRTTTHAFVTEEKDSKPVITPLSLFLKIDHEDLGLLEQISESEKRRFWLHSWLRGSSTIAVGRVHPTSGQIKSWETHTLASLALGQEPQALEWFEPMEKFRLVYDTFTSLFSLPTGNYLIKYDGGKAKMAQVYMATASKPSQTTATSDRAPSPFFDLHDHMTTAGATDLEIMDYILPTWPSQPQRVPYTFRTGTYCFAFFVDGVCPLLATNQHCSALHLRQSSTRPWLFEDFTDLLKKMKKTEFTVPPNTRPFHLEPAFTFCRHATPMDVSDPHSPVRCCAKRSAGTSVCALPHLTVHQVAERVADAALREQRTRRKKHKSGNRERRRPFQ